MLRTAGLAPGDDPSAAAWVLFPGEPSAWSPGARPPPDLPVFTVLDVPSDARRLPAAQRDANIFFLSYRRADAERIARQLHQALTRHGFEVFLDDFSVPRGVDFQAHREDALSEVDLVLLLVSRRIDESRWVEREIDLAVGRGVGVCALRLPNAPELWRWWSRFDADQRHRVFARDLSGRGDDRRLKARVLPEVVAAVHRARGPAILRRVTHLLRWAHRRLDLEPGVGLGDLSRNGRLVGRAFPFRPRLPELDALRTATDAAPLQVVYPEAAPRSPAAGALRWFGELSDAAPGYSACQLHAIDGRLR